MGLVVFIPVGARRATFAGRSLRPSGTGRFSLRYPEFVSE